MADRRELLEQLRQELFAARSCLPSDEAIAEIAQGQHDVVEVRAMVDGVREALDAMEGLQRELERSESAPRERCPGCGVTDFPHRDGCPHEAMLAARAASEVRRG